MHASILTLRGVSLPCSLHISRTRQLRAQPPLRHAVQRQWLLCRLSVQADPRSAGQRMRAGLRQAMVHDTWPWAGKAPNPVGDLRGVSCGAPDGLPWPVWGWQVHTGRPHPISGTTQPFRNAFALPERSSAHLLALCVSPCAVQYVVHGCGAATH